MLRVLIIVLSVSCLGCDVDLEDWRENAGRDAVPTSTPMDASRDQSPAGSCQEKLDEIRAAFPEEYRGTVATFYPNRGSARVVYGLQTFPCTGGRGTVYGLDGNVLEVPVNTETWAGQHCWTPEEWSGATCLDEDGRLSCQIVDILRASATLLYDPELFTCNWFLYPDFSNVLVCPLDGPCSFGGVANSPLSIPDSGAASEAIVDAGATAASAASMTDSSLDASVANVDAVVP